VKENLVMKRKTEKPVIKSMVTTRMSTCLKIEICMETTPNGPMNLISKRKKVKANKEKIVKEVEVMKNLKKVNPERVKILKMIPDLKRKRVRDKDLMISWKVKKVITWIKRTIKKKVKRAKILNLRKMEKARVIPRTAKVTVALVKKVKILNLNLRRMET
jgi:hypothetical protein